jgi:hypothetical protein
MHIEINDFGATPAWSACAWPRHWRNYPHEPSTRHHPSAARPQLYRAERPRARPHPAGRRQQPRTGRPLRSAILTLARYAGHCGAGR